MDLIWVVPAIFFLISFLFSMIGLGGGQVYVPVLFWLGMDFKTEAIPLGMLLSVVTSSSSALTYARKGLVNWRLALSFGLPMVFLPPLGAWVNTNLPTKPVILTFALFTAAGASLMLSGWRPGKGHLSTRRQTILGVWAGGILGFFTGLLGRGGGTFIVPLLFVAGLELKIAAATSTMVVTFSGISSFTSHIATAAQPDWPIWILCAIAVFAGSQIGSRLMAGKLGSRAVKMMFGMSLLGVAAFLIVKDVIL